MADYTLTLEDSTVGTRPRLPITEYEGTSFTVEVITETGEDWYLSQDLNCTTVPTTGASGDVVTITPFFEDLDCRCFSLFRGVLDNTVQGQTIGVFNYTAVDANYGLQVFNENGDLIIDPRTSFVRLVSNGLIPTVSPGTTYTIPIVGMVNDGTWDVITGWTINNQPSTDIGVIACDYSMSIGTNQFTIDGSDGGWTSTNLAWWVIRW